MKLKKLKISISLQISIFLVLVAFIPVLVMMALNTYEKQQLEMFETLNVQQGRIVAASLEYSGNSAEASQGILENMKGAFVSRIRILDREGSLIADSARYQIQQKEVLDSAVNSRYEKTVSETKEKIDAEDSFVYRVFSLPIRIYRKLLRRPALSLYDTADFYNNNSFAAGEEIQQALKGKYGAVTRISTGNQVSVTLYSALPVFDKDKKVQGVVLVSRSTYRILRNLYELRRDMAVVYLKSLIAVVLIAIFFAFRISLPLKKLSLQATDCADKKGRIFFTKFTGSRRIDEIGELSRSFTSLIERLNKRIQFSQAFSSDISHEFKNPLTAIRSSAELLSDKDLSDEDREQLSRAVIDEVNHLQMLLTGVRNISKIDAGEKLELHSIQVVAFLKNIISRVEKKYEGKNLSIKIADTISEDFTLMIPEDYFDRLAENLIDNAASFGTNVLVTPLVDNSDGGKGKFHLTVEDDGKGISKDSIEKIFERFYSERDEQNKAGHTGLGLSTVKAISDALEGQVLVENSTELGGAKFTVIF